jgi:phosphoribosylformylglycinamidine synthase II
LAIQEVRVMNKLNFPDTIGEALLYDIHHTLGITDISQVRTAKVYRFQGISEAEAGYIADRLLAEELFQQFSINDGSLLQGQLVVEVAYKPGVMNPEAASLMKSVADLGITGIKAADSSREYAFFGPGVSSTSINQVLKKLLLNETIEKVVTEKPETLILEGRLGVTEIIPIRNMSDQELMELSKDKLFLNLEEMNTIRKYFIDLDRDPTDCEVETLAQTWSEHCGHKTFRAKLLVNGEVKTPLLKRLQKSTKEANHPLVLSAFVDNSGVMSFYDGWAICGKVETHNSPSAIEPYGGAMTGSGGVFRDIMGTGLGARVIASTDMFCFAPPWMDSEQIPPGCLHPKYMLRRVVAGVRDYGNRMGIPTNNGSVHFHPDFRAKPTVIVGAYGLLPEASSKKGSPQTGDLAVVMGGRTGRDGIHGATFSSGEMTHRTIEVNANAVQIGNAIEEKRTADALLAATEAGLIRAVTDCGAGGFGSAFGEMGSEIGVEIWLDKAPLKYQGLNPWEIWLSESQERMALAIDPQNWLKFNDICKMYNVEAVVAGRFTGDRMLRVTFDGQNVCLLDMEFLHNGLPDKKLVASWVSPQISEARPDSPADWVEAYCQIMADPDVCSKEPIVRMYDHGVQGTSSLPPFTGVMSDGPNDATVIAPIYGKNYGVVISHGMNPGLNNINPYHGSIWAAVEAVSNAVAVGADPSQLCLIDNFIWPFPDEESLGALDMAVDACVDFVREFGMPFISGKDSLSSTYRGAEGTVIKIPPVLCISAFGRIKDVTRTVSADIKKAGSVIVLVGQRNIREMAGSVYCNILGVEGTNLPEINLAILNQVFQSLHKAIVKGKLLSCHDISEGGLASALAEMCFGGDIGAEVSLPDSQNPQNFLFNETAGTFIVEIENEADVSELFKGIPYQIIGKTVAEKIIVVNKGNSELFRVEIERLKEAWKAPMKEVFGP